MNVRRRFLWVPLIAILLLCSSAIQQDTDKYFEIAKNLEIFTNVYKELNTHYVDDLNPNQLMRTGIDAIMNSLDPYTVYYSESEVESYRLSTDETYSGLGASSDFIDGKVTITSISKNGPSHKAGIRVGDQISRINGQSTEGRAYDEVMQFLRGFPGTSVQLTVDRPADNQSYTYKLTRSEVDVPNVPYSGMVNNHVGYISLTTFTRDAGRNVARALRDLKDENDLKGIILDLRSNGGGLLSEAVDILGIFLPQGLPVVSTRGKVRDRDQNYNTRRMPIDVELPLVVLVNKTSASASEIVAGAIQDYDRGVIMGQRSYGKGLVQNFQEVGYNSRMKVTISKYYIPSGRCIQSVEYANGEPVDIDDSEREIFYTKNKRPVLDGGGITPDIKIPLPDDPLVLKSLKKQHWIFKYANEYVSSYPDTPSLAQFSFENFKGFTSYLKDNQFSFESEEEKTLEKLRQQLMDRPDGAKMVKSLEAISEQIVSEKTDDLDEYRAAVAEEIERELVRRYFFQEGLTRHNLLKDHEISQAADLIMNDTQYQSLLL